MKKILALLILLAVAAAAFAHHTSGTTTVILVRHAEKVADAGDDPPLSDSGEARARELARVLGATPIDAIYVTPWERTRRTASHLAAALKLTPIEVKTGSTYANDVVSRIREKHAGQTVVVVGHSNSTQHVIKALGIADAPAIADSQYDDLFIVTIAEGSEPRLVSLRYGALVR